VWESGLLVEVINEGFPLGGEYFLVKIVFPFLRNRCILDSIKGNFFQVAQLKVPGQSQVAIVKVNALVVKEARIITADGELEAFMH